MNFFAHYTNETNIIEFNKVSSENKFLLMELSKMSYLDILKMPISECRKYVQWKVKYDKERQEAQKKAMENMKR